MPLLLLLDVGIKLGMRSLDLADTGPHSVRGTAIHSVRGTAIHSVRGTV